MTSAARLWGSALARATVFLAALLLGACSGIGDHLPTAAGGLPEDAPQRAATPSAFPAVHDMPPSRSDTPLTAAQQKQLEAELIAARARAAAPPGSAPPTPPAGTTASTASSQR